MAAGRFYLRGKHIKDYDMRMLKYATPTIMGWDIFCWREITSYERTDLGLSQWIMTMHQD